MEEILMQYGWIGYVLLGIIVLNQVVEAIVKILAFIKDKTKTSLDDKAWELLKKIGGVLSRIVGIIPKFTWKKEKQEDNAEVGDEKQKES